MAISTSMWSQNNRFHSCALWKILQGMTIDNHIMFDDFNSVLQVLHYKHSNMTINNLIREINLKNNLDFM